MVPALIVWSLLLFMLMLCSFSEWLPVSLSGVLALAVALVFLSFGFRLNIRSALLSVLCNRLILIIQSVFVVSAYGYGQLKLHYGADLPEIDDVGFWAIGRVFDVFVVWFGLMLVLFILAETWVILFSRSLNLSWYALFGVSVSLAVGVIMAGEYLDLAVEAWLSAVVMYVIVFLALVGGLRFDVGMSRRVRKN